MNAQSTRPSLNLMYIQAVWVKIQGRRCHWCKVILDKGSMALRGTRFTKNNYPWRTWWHMGDRNCFIESSVEWLEANPYVLKPRGIRGPSLDLTRDQWIMRTRLINKMYYWTQKNKQLANYFNLNRSEIESNNVRIRAITAEFENCGGAPKKRKH